MKKIKIEDAVGMVLGHDCTQIIPGKYKGPRFRRGHLIREEDIPEFLKIGKEHVYVMKLKAGIVHEDWLSQRCVSGFVVVADKVSRLRFGLIGVRRSRLEYHQLPCPCQRRHVHVRLRAAPLAEPQTEIDRD